MRVEPLVDTTLEAGGGAVGVSSVARPHARPNIVLLVVALASVWIFWGSTYAAIHIAISSVPPFVMAALRFITAGVILWIFSALRGKGRPTLGEWRTALVTGTTLLLLGNGMTSWSLQYVPTGISSLILSISPVWMALFAFLATRERPTRAAAIGMLLGFIGLAVLLAPKTSGPMPFVPTLLLVLASASWGFGSIFQRGAQSKRLMLATAMQMVIGGVLIGIEALVFGEWQHFDIHAVTLASLGGFTWLVLFGSLVGYTAYLWTMQNAPVALGSTFAYVNPIVALVLGMILFHERLTPLAILASAIILSGVALMMLPAKNARHVAR